MDIAMLAIGPRDIDILLHNKLLQQNEWQRDSRFGQLAQLARPRRLDDERVKLRIEIEKTLDGIRRLLSFDLGDLGNLPLEPGKLFRSDVLCRDRGRISFKLGANIKNDDHFLIGKFRHKAMPVDDGGQSFNRKTAKRLANRRAAGAGHSRQHLFGQVVAGLQLAEQNRATNALIRPLDRTRSGSASGARLIR
ncbi:hypothetical protein PY365_02355 [Roseiarcaceae bacterium H3SJ34-1]|nr:hypothetical protein [Roseiarcaceae bacterium H3SJ34-1]